MNLEQQVVSLEIAKKLKELGVTQESLWYYREKTFTYSVSELMRRDEVRHLSSLNNVISAFTVAELGELLPSTIPEKSEHHTEYKFFPYKNKDGSWDCIYEYGFCKLDTINGDTEANARGKMLIYLLENKLMEAKS